MKNLLIALITLLASSEALSTPLEYSFTIDFDGIVTSGGGITLSDAPLTTHSDIPMPPEYFLTFRLDGIGEPGVFGLTPTDEAFFGAIRFYSPLAANLDSAYVVVQSFSVMVGNTTWDYQTQLWGGAYVSTDQSGHLKEINSLMVDTPSSIFSIGDASNVTWSAIDKLSGDGTCGYWPIGTISGFCAYGGAGGSEYCVGSRCTRTQQSSSPANRARRCADRAP